MTRPLTFTAADRLLVFAPHPDDETIATGELIQLARASGAVVHVVFATDGDNNPWPQRWCERRLHIPVRGQLVEPAREVVEPFCDCGVGCCQLLGCEPERLELRGDLVDPRIGLDPRIGDDLLPGPCQRLRKRRGRHHLGWELPLDVLQLCRERVEHGTIGRQRIEAGNDFLDFFRGCRGLDDSADLALDCRERRSELV
jgi:hypothetical protein